MPWSTNDLEIPGRGNLESMWRCLVLVWVVGCTFKPAASGTVHDADVEGGPGGEAGNSDIDAKVFLDAKVFHDAPTTTLFCPASYGLHDVARPSSFYRLVTASANWASSEATCQGDASVTTLPTHLIVLDDAAELTWSYNLTTSQGWIGESDRKTEGTFLAVTSQSPYVGSATGNVSSKDCLMAFDASTTAAETCDNGHPFLCECDGLAAVAANF